MIQNQDAIIDEDEDEFNLRPDRPVESDEAIIGDLITRKLETSIVFLNAYKDFPNMAYDKSKQIFALSNKPPQIFSSVEDKLLAFRQRFTLVREKMLKSKDYVFPFQNNVNSADQSIIKISEVGSLLGSKGEKNILGMIFQGENNHYYIQDLNAKITIHFDVKSTLVEPWDSS